MKELLMMAFLPFLGMFFGDEPPGDPPADPPTDPPADPPASWKDSLPQEIREDAGFSRFDADTVQNSYSKLYKSYREVEQKVGAKGIIKPKDDASPEAWAKYYNENGRPEKAEGYDLKLPEGFTDEDRNPDFEKALRETLYESGASQKQAERIYKDAMEAVKAGDKKVNDAREKLYVDAANALKREWGGNFDRNHALVAKFVEKFGGADVKKFFDDNADVGNNAHIAKMLHNAANAMSEDIIEKGGISALITTPAQAKARIAEIDASLNLPKKEQHPYWQGDKDAVKEYEELLKIAEGIK